MIQLELSALADSDCHELTLEDGRTAFLVRRGGRLYGYINRCPHIGIELNWLPNQFLDLSGELIQCSTHGALFRIEDGHCIHGPCHGDQLEPLDLQVKGEWIAISAQPA